MTQLLQAVDITVTFGGLRALNNVSVDVHRGSVVGLIGPNGAGKTTLFNVISGLQKPDSGAVLVEGQDITRIPPSRRAALGIGRSFQNLGLIPMETVRTNLLAAQFRSTRYGGADLLVRPWRWWREERRADRRALEIATEFNLAEQLDQRVAELSFAKARFVELACVLAEGPTLMLLDEPTTGLDLGEVAALLDLLRAQRESNRTVLLVAHDVRFVMDLCDFVYVLSVGSLLAAGTPAEIQSHPEVIDAYLGRSA
jgi:branched-chain amino acid transport system ATP-binding protein